MSGIKKEFIKTFNEIINNNKQKELRDIWRKGKMNFTNFISPLILKIAPLIKMESTYSYWSLDFIFYNDVFENINYNLKDGKWAKKINVIIEHENEIENETASRVCVRHRGNHRHFCLCWMRNQPRCGSVVNHGSLGVL